MLAQELHKKVITKLKRRKIYARFKDNIWAADLAEIGSLSSNNTSVKYSLRVIDAFIKYAWVKSLKDKKTKIVFYGFIEILNESKRKSNKLWVDQRKKIHNSFMPKWLDDNYILLYLTHNEGKLVVAEKFIKSL